MGSLRDIARGRDKELKSMSFMEFLFNVFLMSLGLALTGWGVLQGFAVFGNPDLRLMLVFVAVGILSLIWAIKRAGDWFQAVFELSIGLLLAFHSSMVWSSLIPFGIGLFFIVVGLLEYRSNRKMVG